jgi:hypothetical protein
MTITRSDFVKALKPGVNEWFGMSYSEEKQQFTVVFDLDAGTKAAYEEDVMVPGFGLASVKTEGGAITFTSHQQGYVARYDHVVYGLGYRITREEIEDNKYPKLAAFRSKALGNSMRKTKEIIYANILNNAFSSSFTMGTASDGKALCTTDHPTLGGNLSNELPVGAALGEKPLEDLCTQIRQAVDENGLRAALKSRLLIVPNTLEFKATRIVTATKQSGTANNDPNALRQLGKLPEGIFVYDYLTDSTNWFIKTDCDSGLKRFQRRALELDDDDDFDTENVKFKATERYSGGWSNWRSLYGSEPA